MTVLPQSSDKFTYLCAMEAGRVATGADLIRAVDGLQYFAMRSGLVEKWGQDLVQKRMAAAFKHVRRPR